MSAFNLITEKAEKDEKEPGRLLSVKVEKSSCYKGASDSQAYFNWSMPFYTGELKNH